MVYVALLRGINVGGNNKIDMKQLRITFERIGMKSVLTYINTGNIIFTSEESNQITLSQVVEEAIEKDYGLKIKVLIRSLKNYIKVINSIPESWTNDQEMKTDVMFLWEEIDHESILDSLVIDPDIDTVKYVDGAIIWSVAKKDHIRSGMLKLVGTKIYKQMTIRNVNTTRKIYELMQNTEQ